MIRPASIAIQKTFDDAHIRCRVNEVMEASIVEAGFALDNGPNVLVRFISRDNDNDVAVRVFDLIRVKEEQRDAVAKVVNELNMEYRYLKFVIHPCGSVHVEDDLCARTDNVGEIAQETFGRYRNILRQAYPRLMKAVLA